MSDDITFVGESNGEDPNSFRAIFLLQLSRMTKIGSQDFHGGYWKEKISANGYVEKVYVPSTTDEYNNAVRVLSDILCPYFDDDMNKSEKEVLNKISKIEDEELTKEDTTQENKKYMVGLRSLPHIRILFRELNKFMHRTNYLESETYED